VCRVRPSKQSKQSNQSTTIQTVQFKITSLLQSYRNRRERGGRSRKGLWRGIPVGLRAAPRPHNFLGF
jgi:hypothetical protein